MTIELRPYQQEAVEAIYRHLREHDDNPCVVIPTAGGKTPVMATVCRDAVGRWRGRVLIVVPCGLNAGLFTLPARTSRKSGSSSRLQFDQTAKESLPPLCVAEDLKFAAARIEWPRRPLNTPRDGEPAIMTCLNHCRAGHCAARQRLCVARPVPPTRREVIQPVDRFPLCGNR